eukprot:11996_1
MQLDLFNFRKCGKQEGYWVCEMLVDQMKHVIPILESHFCEDDEDKDYLDLKFIFDHSTNHDKYASDALVANRMNRRPGGKQPILRNGYYKDTTGNRVSQQMWIDVNGERVAKGMELVLKERGVVIPSEWNVPDLRKELASHDDFKSQLSMLEEYIVSQGHSCDFIPKFHCELNECELIWAIGKDRFIRHNTFHTASHIQRLKTAFETITKKEVRNIFLKIRDYETAYRGGATTTTVENFVAKMKKDRKHHRNILVPASIRDNT